MFAGKTKAPLDQIYHAHKGSILNLGDLFDLITLAPPQSEMCLTTLTFRVNGLMAECILPSASQDIHPVIFNHYMPMISVLLLYGLMD